MMLFLVKPLPTFGNYTVQSVLISRSFGTRKSILPAIRMRLGALEVEMEFAAIVLFSSVALWIAEEMNGNSL